MAHHRALGAARGAGGVEDRGEVVGPGGGAADIGIAALAPLGEGARAVGVQGEDCTDAGLFGDGPDLVLALRLADRDARLRVAQEIGDLGRPIGGVERQVDGADAQAGEVEEDRLGRFLHLNGDAVAFFHAEAGQQPCHAAGEAFQIGVAVAATVRRLDEGRGPLGRKARLEQRVEIVAHVPSPREVRPRQARIFRPPRDEFCRMRGGGTSLRSERGIRPGAGSPGAGCLPPVLTFM